MPTRSGAADTSRQSFGLPYRNQELQICIFQQRETGNIMVSGVLQQCHVVLQVQNTQPIGDTVIGLILDQDQIWIIESKKYLIQNLSDPKIPTGISETSSWLRKVAPRSPERPIIVRIAWPNI